MWKYICVTIFLIACCNAGPVGQQRKNMPIKAREDSVMAVQESEAETEMQTSGNAAETEAAPLVGTLTLPSNATSIRADITDSFSCANKSYGYYADVENDCQIFHVCLPVTYADGKENTFRWSFICPEETIFSQESFTCMRREDMTIECADSSRYYELNGNFGLPVEEEKQPAAAESEQLEQQKPQPEESEMPAPAEPAAVAAPEPVPESAKPVKVQKPKPKPNRRKPAVTYNKPQRKVPVPATAAPVVEPEEEAEPEPEPEPVVVAQLASKPVKPQRFNVRPNKERPQAIKPAVSAPATPMRNELFNSIRKRPAIFNKHSSNKLVQESEAAVTEAIQIQVELSEPQPTLKLQTMFVDAAPEVPVQIVEEPAAEASEHVVAIAEPEKEEALPEAVVEAESIKAEETAEQDAPMKVEVEEMQPIEAIEEIPAVVEEILEQKPQEIEQAQEQSQQLAQEQLEEQPEQQSENLSEKQPQEQPAEQTEEQSENEAQKLEIAHIEPAIVESSSSNEEALNNIEAMEAAKPADAPVSLPATPEMAQPNPLVEEMLDNSASNNEIKESIGGFKPVDPVMAAEAEQLITDFLNTLRKHEEKTETDISNAAMDMAETNVSIEEAKLPEPEIIDKNASVEEQLLETEPEPKPQLKLKQDSPIFNIMQLNHLPADYQIPVQVFSAPETEKESQSEAIKELTAESEIKPVEIDQVQEPNLATAAYMPSISIDDIVELVKERLDQNPKNEQLTPMELILTPGAAAPMALIPSNSIKTETEQQPENAPIAELESEPASEITSEIAAAPASEITSEIASIPASEITSEIASVPASAITSAITSEIASEIASEPSSVSASEITSEIASAPASEPQPEPTSDSATAQESEQEEVILPIYKRISSAEPNMSKVQTSPVTVSKVEVEAKPEEEKTPSVSEAKSTSRMDARKRRFLFRADSS
ncbi:titin homolog [Drosophila innubila]|uniref:titin homolog n=1 Tax=Drosophila innubila TaxID=198719 RepID=UPI00148C560D|nr:titin homolog [Drosophila innubila]